jgi:hypothetical protein
MKLFAHNLQKIIGYLNSSQKIPNFKKNQLKQSLGSEVIIILNSAIFSGFFFQKSRVICIVNYFLKTLVFFLGYGKQAIFYWKR